LQVIYAIPNAQQACRHKTSSDSVSEGGLHNIQTSGIKWRSGNTESLVQE
jgi:hypothetical protein